MSIKKINADISALLMLCLLCHYGITIYSFLNAWYNPVIVKAAAWATAGCFVVHAVISAYLLIFVHDHPKKLYARLNKRMAAQRVTALLSFAVLPVHVQNFSFLETQTPLTESRLMVFAIVELVFYLCVFSHISLSFSRACITFGDVRSDKAVRNIDITVTIICSGLLIVGCYAIASFLITWPRI